MCEGLLHLHYKDIVHQDLKPENIMVSRGGNEYKYEVFVTPLRLYKYEIRDNSSATFTRLMF